MKQKNVGLRRKIISITCILISIMSLVLILLSYRKFYDTHIDLYFDKALGIVKMLAAEVDSEKIAYYIETGETDEEYEELLSLFNNVKENTTGLNYLYILVPYDNHFIYVLDAYTPEDDMDNISKLGDVFEYGDTEYTYFLPDVKAKSASTQIVYGQDVGFGRTISVWAPVLGKNGEVVAMVEADYVISELNAAINSYVRRILVILLLAQLLISAILIKVIDSNVINPILILTRYIKSYETGNDLAINKEFKEDNEIRWLAESFDDMMVKIKDYVRDIEKVTAEKERIGAELNIATQIQADMLPCIFPPFPGRHEMDLFASMTPAKEVGGDFFDFFLVDDNHLALVIADVSGKGVPAALFMVIAKTLIKNQMLQGATPHETLERVNNQLCENNEAEMFVTAWVGLYEISTGKLTASNAGHEFPVIKRNDGSFELYKDQHGLVLAALEGMIYNEYTIELGAGDRLFVFTDGVVEATNLKKELFGTERLLDALNGLADCSLEQMLCGLKAEIDAFAGEEPQFDDITMLAFQVNVVGRELS